jgi:hypothetical protein
MCSYAVNSRAELEVTTTMRWKPRPGKLDTLLIELHVRYRSGVKRNNNNNNNNNNNKHTS